MTDELTDEQVEDELVSRMVKAETSLAFLETRTKDLTAKARTLVDLTDDAERNHGGLISVALLRAKNELRLELSRWK